MPGMRAGSSRVAVVLHTQTRMCLAGAVPGVEARGDVPVRIGHGLTTMRVLCVCRRRRGRLRDLLTLRHLTRHPRMRWYGGIGRVLLPRESAAAAALERRVRGHLRPAHPGGQRPRERMVRVQLGRGQVWMLLHQMLLLLRRVRVRIGLLLVLVLRMYALLGMMLRLHIVLLVLVLWLLVRRRLLLHVRLLAMLLLLLLVAMPVRMLLMLVATLCATSLARRRPHILLHRHTRGSERWVATRSCTTVCVPLRRTLPSLHWTFLRRTSSRSACARPPHASPTTSSRGRHALREGACLPLRRDCGGRYGCQVC